MRRFILIALAGLILAILVPQLLAQQNPGAPPNSILQVVDSEPLFGQELGLSDPIQLFFDRVLDCGTIGAGFSIQPFVEGTLACDGASLTFTPDVSWERATTYQVTLNLELRGLDASQLLEPYELTLDTVGFLAVSETFPSPNAQGVTSDTPITVIFNRPVVPLQIFEEREDLPNPLQIEPAIEGTGRWINTSIYAFEPEAGLLSGTTYAVRIAAGLEAVDGAVLPDDVIFVFSTNAPETTYFSPNMGERGIQLDDDVQMSFSHPMDTESVEDAFHLYPVTTEQAKDSEQQTFIVGEPVDGSFEWNDDNTGFSFKPDDQLQIESRYRAALDAGTKAATGGDGVDAFTWDFQTVPYPAISWTSPQDGEAGVRPYWGFEIGFVSPMNLETLEDKIHISPVTITEPRYYYRGYGYSYEVSFLPYPNTEYTITIDPGMEDIYGNKIEEGLTVTYTTDGYPPEVSLQTSGAIGFYSAYRDPTQVFVTYRNMNHFDLSLYRVPMNAFGTRVLSRDYSTWDIARAFAGNASTLMRTWTVDGTGVPQDALRYDLLEFDADMPASSLSCSEALPSRLQLGDMAVVLTDPDPVRARTAPVSGDIVELLYRDYALEILSEPTCQEDGLIWYNVRLRDDVTAWVAESFGGEYLIGAATQGTTTPVAVTDGDGAGLDPGIYYLRLDYDIADRDRDQHHIMVVGTANLVVKNTVDTVMVWATDVQSGHPLSDVPITIYAPGMVPVAQGRTDDSGLLFVPVPENDDLYLRRLAILDDGTNFGIGWTESTDGIEPYQFGQSYDFRPSQHRIYMYSDRPIYRPGQPVYFRGVVRAKDDVTYTPPNLDSIYVTITTNRGDTIFSEYVPVTPYGSFSGQIDLADDAGLGRYRITASMSETQEYGSVSGGVSFTVAEFRLPEFQVELTAQEPEVLQGDTIAVTVDSTYFFGGSVSNANIEYSVVADNYNFRYDGPGYYSFADYDRDGGPGAYYASSSRGSIASGTAMTDDAGEFTIEIPADLGDVSQSQTFSIEAVVSDESNQVVAGRTSVTVHQGEIYVGVRAKQYVSRSGEDAELEVIAVDWDSNPVRRQRVNYEIYERIWSSVQEQDSATGRTIWKWDVEEKLVADGDVRTDDDGLATFDFVPENGGTYKVVVISRDDEGHEVRGSTYMWVSSSRYVSWRQQNSNRIDLISDQEDYSVGDTAQILITSPFQGTTEALITVERGDVLLMERVTMDSNSYVYELPITKKFSPNIYVSVLIVKGVDENNPVASFRMGYLQLGVDIEQRELNIDIEANVDRTSPQETVTYTVQTSDWRGNPVPAEVGIGVTDLAALSIVPTNSSPMLTYFYGTQSLSVRTSTMLTENTDQLTQETLDTVKGGGGGFAVDGLVEIRGEFIDTPYWNPAVVTDDNGQASFDVRLPDNLTTWRLDARAVTLALDGDMLVGQNTFDLLSTKPVLIRPVTPRFFVVGDEVVLSAVVNNNTTEEQRVDVSINVEGLTLKSDRTQQVRIDPDGRARVTWEVVVEDVEQVRVSFVADAGDYTDGSISAVSMDDEGTLPVYRYEVPETVGTAGMLDTVGSRVESIALPRRFDVREGTLTINVDQSLAATTVDSMLANENVTYYTCEWYITRLLGAVQLLKGAQVVDFNDPTFEPALDARINNSLQVLFAAQQADGGWGWTYRSRSHELVTAYALIGLIEAREMGYTVPQRVIDRAQQFVGGRFTAPTINQRHWQANRQVLMLYAMAYSGAPDIGRTANYYDHRENLDLYGQSMLAETFYLIDSTDTSRTDVLVTDILSQASLSAAGVHWDETRNDYWNWGTDTRTTAMILHMLVRLRPKSDLLPNVVRYLTVQRKADRWSTTQETAWAVWALSDWMVSSGELHPDYAYDVSFNGETRLSAQATSDTARDRQTLFIDISEMMRDQANALEFSRIGTNEGNLYYTAYLDVNLPVPEVEALDNGIIVERYFRLQDDEEGKPITEARVGDVIEARVTIIAPNSLHFVTVRSPHPAGAEAIDPQLQTSQQQGTNTSFQRTNRRYGWGWWYFSEIEFRDDGAYLFADYLPSGTYEFVYTLRAGVPGTYNVIPATAQEVYFPDVQGRSDGLSFTIR